MNYPVVATGAALIYAGAVAATVVGPAVVGPVVPAVVGPAVVGPVAAAGGAGTLGGIAGPLAFGALGIFGLGLLTICNTGP